MKDLSLDGLVGSSSEEEASREWETEAARLIDAMMRTASFAAAAGREIDLVRDFPSGMSAPQEE